MSAIRKLSTVDASFLYLETPEMPMHVGSMAIFKPRPGYGGELLRGVQEADRLAAASGADPDLQARKVAARHRQSELGRSTISSTSTAISSAPACPRPPIARRSQRTVGWMHAKLLNRARPLWEFYVFEGLKDGEIGLYSKVHHACIDGGAGAALTEIVYDVTTTPREVAKSRHRRRRPRATCAMSPRRSWNPMSNSGASPAPISAA